MELMKKKEEQRKFLEENPIWISGFTCAEGCFTAYLLAYPKAKWGLQLGLDFNITQSSDDKLLLQCIAKSMGFETTRVYDKPNNVSVFAVRSIKELTSKIIPFFDKNKLIGSKQIHYNIWKELLVERSSKDYLSNDKTKACESFCKMANLLIKLNNRNSVNLMENISLDLYNTVKLKKLVIIIDWLNNLTTVPTLLEKEALKNKLLELRSLSKDKE